MNSVCDSQPALRFHVPPEFCLYWLATGSAIVTFYGILLLVPRHVTPQDLSTWGILPFLLFGLIAFQCVRSGTASIGTALALGILGLALRLSLGIFMYSHVLEQGGFGSLFIKDDKYFFDSAVQVVSASNIGVGIQSAIQYTGTQIGPVLFDVIPVALFGADPRNVVALASVVGAFTVVLTYQFALRFVPSRWALFAAFIMAIYPQQVYLAAAIQRDFVLVLTFLIAGLSLVRIQDCLVERKSCMAPVMWLFLAFMLTTAWRFAFGVALLVIALAFLAVNSRRRRVTSIAISSVGACLVAILSVYVVRSGDLRLLLMNPFVGFDTMRAQHLTAANTFGFLQNAAGASRFVLLPVTFTLATVFGFGRYQGLPNLDLVSIGYVWFWLPLILPMAIGVCLVLVRHRRAWFLLWGTPALILLISALTYQGMVPRYRSAAEPYMIVLAALGLRAMRPRLASYWSGVSVFCTVFLWSVWLSAVPDRLMLVHTSIIVCGLTCLLVTVMSGQRMMISEQAGQLD